MAPLIPLPEDLPLFLEPYLPHGNHPHVTLTYAQSLDSRISISPGVQTAISHLETKTMTHYLRSKHDAILVGIGTVLADDPGLNCRYNSHKIRPVVIDPSFKGQSLLLSSRLVQNVQDGVGLPVIIVVLDGCRVCSVPESCQIVELPLQLNGRFAWRDILSRLQELQINSVMIEGGAQVINDLLVSDVVDSLIVTVGPVFLGSKGVQVSPVNKVELGEVAWWTGVQDSVLGAKMR